MNTRTWFPTLTLAGILLIGFAHAAEPEDKGHRVPTRGHQKKAEVTIRGVSRCEYAKNGVEDSVALANKLLPLRQENPPGSQRGAHRSHDEVSLEQVVAVRKAGVPPVIEIKLGRGVKMKMVYIPPADS